MEYILNALIKTITLTSLLTSSLMADFTRVEMGAGLWNAESSGSASYVSGALSGTDTSNGQDTTNAYVWILMKHPIPLIPNLRLEYANVSSSGIAVGTFENFSSTTGRTQLELTK